VITRALAWPRTMLLSNQLRRLFSDRISQMAGDGPGVMIVPFRDEYYGATIRWCAR
jgi:hypothetical protein